MAEVVEKRFAGPFDVVPYEHFIQSPIGLVPKSNGDSRLIFHLSYPRGGDSVNSGTPQDKCRVEYPDFAEAVKLCIFAGKFCKMGKSDMKSAFRHLGIKVKHFRWLVMKARNPRTGLWSFFLDKCLPFGSSVSWKLFQSFSDAVAWIVKFRTGFNLVNYLDDYFFVALLAVICDGQIDAFLSVCLEINFPVALEKTFWATTKLTFLGMLLDSENQVMCIPIEKVQKGLAMIDIILSKKSRKITIKELQKLCGFLNFLCKCVIPGRAFTRRLYAPTGNSKLKPHHHIRITGEMKSDMRVWKSFLMEPSMLCRPFMDFTKFWTAQELDFYTDSSGNPRFGMGGYCNQEYFAQRWEYDFVVKFKPSIQYLELYAIASAVLLWVKNFKNKRIIIFTDNQNVKRMVNSNTSSCRNCMVLIRLIVLECLIWNVRLYAEYVPTKENEIADALSRFQQKRFLKLTKEKGDHKSRLCIPQELWPMSNLWLKN